LLPGTPLLPGKPAEPVAPGVTPPEYAFTVMAQPAYPCPYGQPMPMQTVVHVSDSGSAMANSNGCNGCSWSSTSSRECLLGCAMGWLFGLCGLLCIACSPHKRGYLRGWLISLIIALTILAGTVLVFLVVLNNPDLAAHLREKVYAVGGDAFPQPAGIN